MAGAVVWFAPGLTAQNALAESGGNLPTLFCAELWKGAITRERYFGIQPGFCPQRGCQGFDQLAVIVEGTGKALRQCCRRVFVWPPDMCSCGHALQERTVLQLPERLAAHFLLWQAGKDLPLSANPFGSALVEVIACSREIC